MAGPAVRVYPRIGGQDGDSLAAIDFPTIDSAFWAAPTLTKTLAAANTYVPGLGYLRINVEGTTYDLLATTNT